jgi:hypothetical protein
VAQSQVDALDFSLQQPVRQGFGRAVNLPLARQESEYAARRIILQRLLDRVDRALDRSILWFSGAAVNDIHGKQLAFARHDRGVIQQFRDPLAIERGRHDEDFQTGNSIPGFASEQRASFEAKRQRQVGVEIAFMKLVEYHQADVGQRRVLLQHSDQDTLGNDFDSAVPADFGFQAHTIADGLTRFFVQQSGHAKGGGSGRNSPRFEHQNLFVPKPRLVQQRQRNHRRFTGAGRCLQHHLVTLGQVLLERIQTIFDGEVVAGQVSLPLGGLTEDQNPKTDSKLIQYSLAQAAGLAWAGRRALKSNPLFCVTRPGGW